MRRLLITLIICLTTFSFTFAQQEDDFPTPETLFTDVVEVLDVQFVEDNSTYLRFDNETRMVSGFHAGEYREYPYPDDLYDISERAFPSWNGLFVFRQFNDVYWEHWMLDPTAGTWELYESVGRCGAYSIAGLSRNFADRIWVFHVDDDNTTMRLCATLTGEMTQPLDVPEGFQAIGIVSFDSDYFAGVPTSSTYEYAVFFGLLDDERHAYSYHFESEEVRDLGVLPSEGDLSVYQWVDDTRLIVSVRDDDSCDRYIADVVTGEITLAISTEGCAFLTRNPDRLVRMTTERDNENLVVACWREIYFIDMDTLTTYDYGDLCYPDLGSDVGVGYYRSVSKDQTQVQIVRFDPTTDDRITLYTGGAIETLRWISEDERFAVLLLDSDPLVNLMPQEGDRLFIDPILRYVDLTANTILYETAIPVNYDNATAYAPSIITPITDNLLLVEIRDVEFEWILNTDSWYVREVDIASRLVRLNGDDVPIETELPPIDIITQEYLIYGVGDIFLSAYDLTTNESFSFTNVLLPNEWWVSIKQGEAENTFIVQVRQIINGMVDRRITAEYIIRLR